MKNDSNGPVESKWSLLQKREVESSGVTHCVPSFLKYFLPETRLLGEEGKFKLFTTFLPQHGSRKKKRREKAVEK